MDVSVSWSDAQLGYIISYNVPKMYKIEALEGNGNESEFFESDVYWRLKSDLESMGIGAEAIAD
jgi:hypothetical protein